MERDVLSGSDSETNEIEKWICDICRTRPVNPYIVDSQLLYNETVLYTDDNGEYWVRCRNCDRRYYAKCVRNLPPDVCECFFRFCGWNMYVCTKCY